VKAPVTVVQQRRAHAVKRAAPLSHAPESVSASADLRR
jgi:hypothetical protein